MFDADRPITTSAQDRLNRTTFAKYLARCMLDHKERDSLVIGLEGGWGVGKTSIINMTVEELNFAASNMLDEEKPIILNFSAWSYSGHDQLIYSFFRRLSSALRGVTYLENADRIIYLLELYVSFHTRQPIPKPLRIKRTWWEKITFQRPDAVYAWESGRDLTQVKAELNELLYNQNHKIIIIIDNISRLYAEEIKQIFQIVKSMGDYCNTVYLLAFDKEQVVRAINRLDGSGGKEYVEKIVQLPFIVPPILQQDIENIFADRVQELIKLVPEGAWNAEYWADIYYGSLKYFFENCRDITRYVNTLSFSYSRLRDVVNPIDFFALTAIEVFLPGIYFGIRDNKDLFTDLLDEVYVLDKEQVQKDKLRCDEILARNNDFPKDVILDLLIQLFPRLRHLYQPKIPFYYSDSRARRLRRISSPDLFDVYFRLSMQAGQIPKSEFDTLLSLASSKEAFDQALTRLNQDDRIIKFLDMMDSKALQTVPREQFQAIINALLDNGDLFPYGISGTLNLDTPMRIHRIIHILLQRVPNSEERFILLQNAIAKAEKSIYIIVHELREQAREHEEELDTYLPLEFRDLQSEELRSLQKLTLRRIEYWAQTQRLIDHPKLIPILYAWRDWADDDNAIKYVKEITTTDRGLIAFLTAAFDPAITDAMTHYEKNPSWEKCLKTVADFIQPKGLEPHAKLLFEDEYFEKLREREQLALMIFLDLTHTTTRKIIPQTSV